MCFGMCPAYDVVLERSGAASFDGRAFVSMMGAHVATLGVDEFDDLARAITFLDFFSLEPIYSSGVLDASGTTTWVRAGTRRVEVVNVGRFGPEELSVIEELIDGCAAGLDWRPVSTADQLDGLSGSDLVQADVEAMFGDREVHWAQRPRSPRPGQ